MTRSWNLQPCLRRLASETMELLTFQSPLVTLRTNRFNIQELHFPPTLYLCVLYLSENKQRRVPLA
jgi:hypothetical protein